MNDIPKRVNGIRQWLKENRLDAIIIPHEDEYLSEYIPPENERLAWATGFTGSAGLAIITQDKAAIFIDGRYTVQVKEQVDSSLYTILHISKDPYLKWLKTILNPNAKVGYASRLQHANWKIYTEKIFAGKITLIPIDKNPIDLLWDDRPSGNMDMAILLDEKYTGMASHRKRKILGVQISKNNCDAAFITQLDSIAWLLNIRGKDVPCNPVLLCHGLLHSDGSFDLFINENKIPEGFHDHVGTKVSVIPPDKMKTRLNEFSGMKIQLDPLTSNAWSKDLIIAAGAALIENNDPCSLPKACKNNVEIQGMKDCHIRDAVAECTFLAWLDEEISNGNLHDEGTLANKLDSLRSEQNNFKGLSFGTISAAGKNAAMCHYNHNNNQEPGKLEMNSVYLVDSGGQYLDGTTDITRTIAVGKPSDFMKKTFTLVLKGHIALGSAKFPEGIAGQHLDTLARQFLWNNGYDFDHGTGHGVGSYLNVHEGPHRIGKGSNNVPLKEGMVVSNEPGYYRENEFGIRLENLIFVKKIGDVDGQKLLGFENLTFVPVDSRLIDISLITVEEKDWINAYHLEVLEKVGPHVEGTTLEWLKNAVHQI